MNKPSWFRLVDALTMLPGAVLSFGALIYALTVGVQSPHGTQGLVLTAVVGMMFVGIWGAFCYQRKKWLDSFTWFPTYGFMVQPENWSLPSEAEFDAVVKKAIDSWTPYFPAESLITAQVNWVWFKKDLNENVMNPAHKKVNGLTIYGGHEIEVDYNKPTDPIERTALRHELGHVVMGNATGQWDNDTHHAFMQKHGLL